MKGCFEEYLERFCEEHKITKEEAMKLQVVKEVQKYYLEVNTGVYSD